MPQVGGTSLLNIREALYRYQQIEAAWFGLDIANGRLLHSPHLGSKRMRASSHMFLMTDFYPKLWTMFASLIFCVFMWGVQ